jgi:hypothetical protein
VPFEPTGDKARRWVVYGHAKDLEPGIFISYDDLAELLGVTNRHAIQEAVSRANRELRRRSLVLKCVIGEGYELSNYDRHEVLLGRQEKDRIRSYMNHHRKGSSEIVDLLGDDYERITQLVFGHYRGQRERLVRYQTLKKFDPHWAETIEVARQYRTSEIAAQASVHLALGHLDPGDRRRVVRWFFGTG